MSDLDGFNGFSEKIEKIEKEFSFMFKECNEAI